MGGRLQLYRAGEGDLIDIVGWVTVSNTSGQSFRRDDQADGGGCAEGAAAGSGGDGSFEMRVMSSAPMTGAVTEKAFDEFHLYSLPRAVTLRDRETKQVEFMRASGVKAAIVYVYDSARHPTKVAVTREFKNSEQNGLGLPLPKGRTRFYRKDNADGRIAFVGEDLIDHTAKNELVRVKTGDAFDIVGERRAVDRSSSSFKGQSEQATEITLRGPARRHRSK